MDIGEDILMSVEWAEFFDATKIIDGVSKKVLIDKMHTDWIIKGYTPTLHFLATLSEEQLRNFNEDAPFTVDHARMLYHALKAYIPMQNKVRIAMLHLLPNFDSRSSRARPMIQGRTIQSPSTKVPTTIRKRKRKRNSKSLSESLLVTAVTRN